MTRDEYRLTAVGTAMGIVAASAFVYAIGCVAADAVKVQPGAAQTQVTASANVNAEAEATLNARIEAAVKAALVQVETRIEKMEASATIGGSHATTTAGGNVTQTTVDSKTSEILAKAQAQTIKWAVLITVTFGCVYVVLHRFRPTRRMLDWGKGKDASDEEKHAGSRNGRWEDDGGRCLSGP